MSDEQRFGEGQDNYLQGMRQAAEAARQFGSAAGTAGATGAAAGEAAANAGIRPRDIIVKLDDQNISSRQDLQEKLQYYRSGETVEIVVSRAENGQYVEKSIEVTMGTKPESSN